jgi:hypothetical protein
VGASDAFGFVGLRKFKELVAILGGGGEKCSSRGGCSMPSPLKKISPRWLFTIGKKKKK